MVVWLITSSSLDASRLSRSAFVKTCRWSSSGMSLRFACLMHLVHYQYVNVANSDSLLKEISTR